MRPMRIAMGVLSLAMLASCTKEVKEQNALTINQDLNTENLSVAAGRQPGQAYMPNEVLVKFKKGTSGQGRANALARISGNVKEHILTKAMERFSDEGVFLVHTPLAALEAISRVKGIEIEFAEPNWIYTHDATSNDPSYAGGSLWGMYGDRTSPANQYGSQAGEAWVVGHTGSSTVYVGIIDEGYMYTHDDLAANAGTNPGEIAGNGLDDDGNGYKDDVYGWDFATGDNSVYDGTGDDHGTHVAGTIGGVGGNGVGVAGVSWNVKMLSAKFLGANGGTTANAIAAVDYFTNLKTRSTNKLNIVATNNSWGGGGFSQALQDAIERANRAGILFIAAAGNGGSDGRGDNLDGRRGASYPASYTNANIISVASITSSGSMSTFSNYGSVSVDLGAPGSGIYSTLPDNKYGSYSGTSMATPHVTGGVALYASTHPTASATAIKTAVLDAARATPTSSLSGKTVTGGRLNVSGF